LLHDCREKAYNAIIQRIICIGLYNDNDRKAVKKTEKFTKISNRLRCIIFTSQCTIIDFIDTSLVLRCRIVAIVVKCYAWSHNWNKIEIKQ